MKKKEIIYCALLLLLITAFLFTTHIYYFIPFKRLFDKNIFYVFDFSKNFYNSFFTRNSFNKNFDYFEYNFMFLKGSLLNSVFTNGLIHIITPVLFPNISLLSLQKSIHSIAVLLLPLMLFLSFRNFGFSRFQSVFATFLGITFFRIDLPQFLLITGKENVYISLYLIFYTLSLFYRYIVASFDFRIILIISLLSAICGYFYGFSLLLIIVPFIFIALVRTKIKSSEVIKSGVVLVVFFLFLNSLWIFPHYVRHGVNGQRILSAKNITLNSNMRVNYNSLKISTLQNPDFAAKVELDILKPLENYFSTNINFLSMISLKNSFGTIILRMILIAFGLCGFALLLLIDKNFQLFYFLGIAIIFLLSSVFYVPLFAVIEKNGQGEIGQYFMIILVNLILMVLTMKTFSIIFLLSQKVKLQNFSNYILGLIIIIILGLNFSTPYYSNILKPEIKPERIIGKLPDGKILALINKLVYRTNKDGRIIIESTANPYEANKNTFSNLFNLPIILAINTDRMFAENLNINPGYSLFRDGKILGKNINDFSLHEMKSFLNLYNIKWIVAYSGESKWFFDKYSDYFEKEEITDFNLFTVKRDTNYFSKGRGKIFIDFSDMIIYDVNPDKKEISIGF